MLTILGYRRITHKIILFSLHIKKIAAYPVKSDSGLPISYRRSSKPRLEMAKSDYIDPKGYWVSPEGGIQRIGDENSQQEVIVKRTDACSEAEWKRVCDALVSAKPAGRVLPQYHVERNCVIIS